jgi:hypothetical protein
VTVPAATIARMDLEARIAESEDSCAAMLDRLIVGNAQMLEELRAFRAETRDGFAAIRSRIGGTGTLTPEFDSFGAAPTRTGEMLEEILQRLPEPGSDRQE